MASGAEKDGDNTFDRYIVDYLLRTGRINTARAMVSAKGIEVSAAATLPIKVHKLTAGTRRREALCRAHQDRDGAGGEALGR